MTPAPASEKSAFNYQGTSASVLRMLVPIVLLVFGLAIWSNHFDDQFHADDFPTIVNNRALDSLSNIPRFFIQPRLFSAEPESADYKPLLTATFAIDRSLTRSNGPGLYQLDTFLWFGFLIFFLYFAFRMIPGTNGGIALFAVALFGLHPIAAETVNYVSRRGQIMGAAGVSLALALWLFWPAAMPKRLGLNLNRVPQNWWQDQIRTHGLMWERTYKGFLKLPIPFYLIPLVPALLADPSSAAFAGLLFVFVGLYDPEARYWRLFVPAVVCGLYWAVQTFVVLRVSPFLRVPVWRYWASEPLVVMRYLFRYFAPGTISADTGFPPVTALWAPQALAGFIGVGLLVAFAVLAGRREQWRGVSLGIWWFLIALAPAALVPQRSVEANPQMFFAAAGLAFAVAHLGGILYARLPAARLNHTANDTANSTSIGAEIVNGVPTTSRARIMALSLLGVAALTVLAGLGWMTRERNAVWATEKTLWSDVIEKSPGNGRGYLGYAAALTAEGDDIEGYKVLLKAVPLSENDGLLQLGLAQAFDKFNKDVDAEFHFRRAIALVPVSAVYSYFGQWLLAHQRWQEAFEISTKALSLNQADVISRHTLMDLYAQRSDWGKVVKLAKETLALNPADETGKRSLSVATASIDQVRQAEEDVKSTPTVDDYLKLSVLYYHSQRYEDCARAAREALRLRPNLAEAYANIAAATHTLGRDDEAIEALREVIRLRPDMAFAKTDLEILLEKKTAAAVK